jgi:hypothetical protein
VVFGDDVGDPDPSAGDQDTENFGEHGRFVDRQVDHTVGDGDVDRGVGQWDVLDVALANQFGR